MSADSISMKQGDTLPPLDAVLTDNGLPKDLTAAASVRCIARNEDGTPLFSRMTVVGAGTGGAVHMDWQAGDTAVIQKFACEFLVTWPDGKVQRFPNDSFLYVVVSESLGS